MDDDRRALLVLAAVVTLVLFWLAYLAATWDYSVKPDQRADAGAAAVSLVRAHHA